MSLTFEKWHGIGNDFVLIDQVPDGIDESDLPELARSVCQRTFGIGADGLLVALPSQLADLKMAMFNPDGSEAEMCGNGLRCLAMWHYRGRRGPNTFQVETQAGILECRIESELVTVMMGEAKLLPGPSQVELDGVMFDSLAVDMGNPHLVVFCPQEIDVQLERWGRTLESHPEFPNRVNVHFLKQGADGSLTQVTWERGAGATLACGTGACACVVAARAHKWCGSTALVHLPGGDLRIALDENRVAMTGPAEHAFTGEWIGRRGAWPDVE